MPRMRALSIEESPGMFRRFRGRGLPSSPGGDRDYSRSMVPLSVLDLPPIVEGSNAADALRNTLDLARHAARRRYRRIWPAEHHGMPAIASAATSVVIGDAAAGSASI